MMMSLKTQMEFMPMQVSMTMMKISMVQNCGIGSDNGTGAKSFSNTALLNKKTKCHRTEAEKPATKCEHVEFNNEKAEAQAEVETDAPEFMQRVDGVLIRALTAGCKKGLVF